MTSFFNSLSKEWTLSIEYQFSTSSSPPTRKFPASFPTCFPISIPASTGFVAAMPSHSLPMANSATLSPTTWLPKINCISSVVRRSVDTSIISRQASLIMSLEVLFLISVKIALTSSEHPINSLIMHILSKRSDRVPTKSTQSRIFPV